MATDTDQQPGSGRPAGTTTSDSVSNVSLPLRPKTQTQDSAALDTPHSHDDGFLGSSQDTTLDEARHAKAGDETKTRGSVTDIDKDLSSQKPMVSVDADQAQLEAQSRKENGDAQQGNDDNTEIAAAPEKKKRKKKKPASQRGLNAPNGFEEFYVDAPVTPAEFTLEEELYAKTRPFSERIQIAIQRYSAKRKFDPIRRSLWVRFLSFGGINTGQKQFTGGEPEADEDTTAADIITLKATEFVSREIVDDEAEQSADNGHDPQFVVDFDGVARAFFSLYVRSYVDVTNPEAVKTYCGVVRNFYNYLLHHNVCNEYANDIYAARRTIDQAEKQLHDMIYLPTLLPGTFSTACCKLYVDPNAANNELFQWQRNANIEKLTQEEAGRIFLGALASMGSDALVDLYQEQNDTQSTCIVNSLDTGLEITGVFPPTRQVRDMYEHPSNHALIPMGHITARTWWWPWAGEEDLTEEEAAALPAKQAAETRDYVFWIDEKTLKKVSEGMKFTADISELSFGVWFIEVVKIIYPSFALAIPNEMMEGWKEHELLPPKGKREQAGENRLEDEQEGNETVDGEAGTDVTDRVVEGVTADPAVAEDKADANLKVPQPDDGSVPGKELDKATDGAGEPISSPAQGQP